jgi:hypothetical protein
MNLHTPFRVLLQAKAQKIQVAFGSSPKHIILLKLSVRAGKVFALESTAPQQGPDFRFSGNFSKKAFGWKRFIRHHTPPNKERRGRKSLLYLRKSLCALC